MFTFFAGKLPLNLIRALSNSTLSGYILCTFYRTILFGWWMNDCVKKMYFLLLYA